MPTDFSDDVCRCARCSAEPYVWVCTVCGNPHCEGTHMRNTAGERLISSALQAAGIARDLPMPKYRYQSEFPAVQPEERGGGQ